MHSLMHSEAESTVASRRSAQRSSLERTVLTEGARRLVAELTRCFAPSIAELLQKRHDRRARIANGEEQLGFLPETAHIRDSDWRVAPAPKDLRKRFVEITGPTDRKMMINALNSGADVFMADLEDSSAPTWANMLAGQVNLRDAVRRTIEWNDAESGKAYRLNERTATLIVRPRGLHLVERHLVVDGKPIAASLVDAGLFLHHTARALLERGSGPYLYL